MKNEKREKANKSRPPVDPIMLIGLFLYCIYAVADHFVGSIPNVVAYPWMIISCILMIVGIYRSGLQLGKTFKSRKK